MTSLKIKIFFAAVIALCFPIISNAQQRCRGEPDGNKFPMPDPASYVVCRTQQEVIQHCRTGFEFDPFVRECNLTASPAENRGSVPNNNGRPAPRPAPPAQPSARNPVTTARPSRPQPRPAQFDGNSRNPCANQPDGTYLIDPTNPNRFYYCLNREALAGNCQDDLHFNINTRSCVIPRSDARPASPPRGQPSATRPPPSSTIGNGNENPTTPSGRRQGTTPLPRRPPTQPRPQPQEFNY